MDRCLGVEACQRQRSSFREAVMGVAVAVEVPAAETRERSGRPIFDAPLCKFLRARANTRSAGSKSNTLDSSSPAAQRRRPIDGDRVSEPDGAVVAGRTPDPLGERTCPRRLVAIPQHLLDSAAAASTRPAPVGAQTRSRARIPDLQRDRICAPAASAGSPRGAVQRRPCRTRRRTLSYSASPSR
jgi:hypothetical protein